jgi:hypothetical protein
MGGERGKRGKRKEKRRKAKKGDTSLLNFNIINTI